jgi:hypothetical protein
MKNKWYVLDILIIASIFFLNIFAFKNNTQHYYGDVSQRARLISSLRPQLADLENKLWGIISDYDPSQGKNVTLAELRYTDLIAKMMSNIDSAAALAKGNDGLLGQFDLLKRSVKSLSNRIDAIQHRFKMRDLDKVSTEMLFPGSKQVYMLSESYVDEMKALIEQIRLVRKVIQENISDYAEMELQGLTKANEKVIKSNRKWFLLNEICIFAAFVLTLILFKSSIGTKR